MTETFRQPLPAAALLVDGDNLPATLAPVLLRACGAAPAIRRVYGDLTTCKGWADLAGLRLMHAGTGKNAADLLLTIDAMDLALTGGISRFFIASSDGDFSHLAHRLREAGHDVTGLGEAKTPQRFRAACARFVILGNAPAPAPAPVDPLSKVVAALRAAGNQARVQELGARAGLRISDLPAASWRQFLTAHPQTFELDPKGPDARVRLVAR